MEGLTRGQLARQGGVNIEAIRYYERQGLLRKPPRSPAGYRMFFTEDVRRIRFIKRAQALGFSLKEIKELLALRLNPGTKCADVRRRAEDKLAYIEQKIQSLHQIKNALTRLVAACAGRGSASECPVLESLERGDAP